MLMQVIVWKPSETPLFTSPCFAKSIPFHRSSKSPPPLRFSSSPLLDANISQ